MSTSVTTPRPQPESEPVLTVSDLAVSFDTADGRRITAVDGVSLTVHKGQTLSLVGESGSGKSVTALAALQLVPQPPGCIDRGQVVYEGRNLLTLQPQDMLSVRGRHIAMIFQEPMTSLNPVYTVGDQLIEAVRLHRPFTRAEARNVVVEALAEVGISDPERRLAAFPHEFSGGMRQRVMIAMALACQPAVLLADEPTTALDVTIQHQILELLGDLQISRNMAIVLITHDLAVVREYADVVCVMYGGRVVEYARADRLFARPRHPYTRGLLSCIPRLGGKRTRLTTVEEVVSNPEEFRQLPGYEYGIIPWWPNMEPPDGLDHVGSSCTLHEIDPGHWVACWRTRYLRQHPTRHPDISDRLRTRA